MTRRMIYPKGAEGLTLGALGVPWVLLRGVFGAKSGVRHLKTKSAALPLAFRASLVVSFSPLEGVAFRGCGKRRCARE